MTEAEADIALQLCGGASPEAIAARRKDQALNDAVARLNQPLLTQLHRARAGDTAAHLAAR